MGIFQQLKKKIMKKFNHTSGKYFDMEDASIYYEETGSKSGSVLLMLHGGFGTLEDFNSMISGLSDEFRIIGIDSRGQGKSTLGNQKLTYQRMQFDIEALLDFLNINSISIIGFSDGGIVAYRMAISSTVKIEKIIAIDARWNLADLEATKEIYSKINAESWKEKFPDSYNTYQKLNPEKDFNILTSALKEMWLDAGETSGYPNEKVNKIKCPTLIIRGDDDHLFSRKSATELADSIKGATFLNIPFAGHESFKDQSEVVKIVVNEFLGDTNNLKK
jgi:pimeloyl-ACP methyl ester carboxylesterase